MKRLMCIRFPEWPLQRIRAAAPEHDDRLLVLYRETRPGALQVAFASREVVRAGVVAGMPLAEARTLLERTGGSRRGRDAARFLEHDPQADLAELKKLAGECRRYSPTVGLDDSEQPDCLLLDVTGCAPLFGGEPRMARRVLGDFRRRGYEAHVAIADTVGAAWAVACFGTQAESDPVRTVPAGRQEPLLQTLPVEALRLSERTVRTLHELDLRRIGQLLALPRPTLPSRFGPEVLQRLDQALGRVPEFVRLECPPEPLQASWSWDEPVDRRNVLEAVLRQLVDQLVRPLKDRREGVRRLRVEIRAPDGERSQLTVGLVRPSASPRHLLDLLRVRLERTALPESVTALQVQVAETGALEICQRGLFEGENDPQTQRRLALLLDRLTGRLGDRCVLRAVPSPDAQPEYACRWIPVAGRNDPRNTSPSRDVSGGCLCALSRPLRLLRRPVPVDVLAVFPAGPPTRFRGRNHRHRVLRQWGPERIETGWWRRAPAYRDYYRVETERGERFWLFRRIGDGAWFLHGIFE